MDGHFVPNITIGPPVVRAIKSVATRPLDVHLMIEEPDRYIEAFVEAGANMISVHVEAVPHLHRTISFIKKLGARAGAVLNPSTPAVALEDIARDLDFVLVMSVNPGFGGQAFIPHSLEKVRRVRAVLDAAGSSAPIEIDGGIDERNGRDGRRGGRHHPGRRPGHLRQPTIPKRATRALRAAASGAPSTPAHDQRPGRALVRRTRVRVRYAETDCMGVVYYANYFVWFEVGRTDWLRDTGWSYRDMEDDGVQLPVIEAHCEYRRAGQVRR